MRVVEQTRTALVGKIGENVSIRRFVRIEAKAGLSSYVHGGSKIGVLVDVVGGDEALAKDTRDAHRCQQAGGACRASKCPPS